MRLNFAEPQQIAVVCLEDEVIALKILSELADGIDIAEALFTPYVPVTFTRSPFARGATDDATDAVDLLHQQHTNAVLACVCADDERQVPSR